MKNRYLLSNVALFLVAVLVLGATAAAQETKIERKDVPAAVLAAFAKAYPKATAKGFSRETENGKTTYEVESVEGKTHRDVTYSANGELVLTEEEIDLVSVPEAARKALKAKYPDARVELAEKVTKGAMVAYEMHLMQAGRKLEFVVDANGKEVKI